MEVNSRCLKFCSTECRNNITPSYEPKGADVWSLGIVLLNLLFHRCPWADPTLDDPDFAEYHSSPVEFLETRFEGIGTEVATFLSSRVLSNIDDANNPMPRASAGEFGKWATKLVRYMGEGSRRASISDATFQIVPTVRQSPRLEGSRLFHSPQHRSPRSSLQLNSTDNIEDSPSRKGSKLSRLPHDLVEELEAQAEYHLPTQPQGETADQTMVALDEAVQNSELEDQEQAGDCNAATKSKHRKRGARKKHKTDGHSSAPDAERVTWPSGIDDGDMTLSQDISLSEVSQNLQALAREISQTTKPSSSSMTAPAKSSPSFATETPTVQSRSSKSRFADRFKGAFANGNSDLQAFTERSRQREIALTGPYRNPTASAPAKMQQSSFTGVSSGGTSSFGSVASTGSWSEEQTNSHWASTGSRRDRLGGKRGDQSSQSQDRSGGTSRHPRSPVLHPHTVSAMGSASSSPSRQSFTPLSSFSSTTSYESRCASRPPRAGLHSIDETCNKQAAGERKASVASVEDHTAPGPAPSLALAPEAVRTLKLAALSSAAVAVPENKQPALAGRLAPHIICEPVAPPTEPPSPPAAAASTASHAKLGRLFNKFSRG